MALLVLADIVGAEDIQAGGGSRVEAMLHDAAVPGLGDHTVGTDPPPGEVLVDEGCQFAGLGLRAMPGHERLRVACDCARTGTAFLLWGQRARFVTGAKIVADGSERHGQGQYRLSSASSGCSKMPI